MAVFCSLNNAYKLLQLDRMSDFVLQTSYIPGFDPGSHWGWGYIPQVKIPVAAIGHVPIFLPKSF